MQERLKRRFLTRRARSPPSPLQVPANNEPAEPTPDGNVKAGEERNKDVELPDVSPISLAFRIALAPQHDGLSVFCEYDARCR